MRTILLCASLLTFASVSSAGEVRIPISYVKQAQGGKARLVQKFIKVQVVPANGEMQVKVGDVPYDQARLPSQALSAALKANTNPQKFRVSWQFSGTHLNFHSTVLYDRRNRTITYLRSGSSGVGDTYKRIYNRVLLSRVNDRMIDQLANSNQGETLASGPLGPVDVETAGLTQYLTRYGAQVVTSKSAVHKSRSASKK